MRLYLLGMLEGLAETMTGLSADDGSELPRYERGRALGLALGDRFPTLRRLVRRVPRPRIRGDASQHDRAPRGRPVEE